LRYGVNDSILSDRRAARQPAESTMTDPTPAAPVLTNRALNRALLARQHLLERSTMPPLAMIEHLVAMQAQNPLDPYVGLWSRLEAFEPAALAGALESRAAVRIGLLRTTLHLVTADDAVRLWPVTREVLRRAWGSSPFRKDLAGVDLDAVLDASRAFLHDEARTASELGAHLAEGWPDRKPTSLAYAARFLLPIVQVPPRGVWGRTGRASWRTIEGWLGVRGPLPDEAAPDDAVLRYLAAFGPASVADIATWSWLTGVRAVVERLRPRLRTFRDEAGRELFDVPDAPLPDADTPAPPRFLPEYDNLLLSHDERRRVIPEANLGRLTGWVGSFLVDGFLAGQWRLDRTRSAATLVLEPFERLRSDDEVALVAEAQALLAFHAAGVPERTVVFGVARPAPTDDRPGIGGRRRPPAGSASG
jgi:Winged helix DNA-binding domain